VTTTPDPQPASTPENSLSDLFSKQLANPTEEDAIIAGFEAMLSSAPVAQVSGAELRARLALAAPDDAGAGADAVESLAIHLYNAHDLDTENLWEDADPSIRIWYLGLAEEVERGGWAPARAARTDIDRPTHG
jgi:hypothetical protein